MSFWIALWVFVFALAACTASLFGAEDWRKNLGFACVMVLIMAAPVFIMMDA